MGFFSVTLIHYLNYVIVCVGVCVLGGYACTILRLLRQIKWLRGQVTATTSGITGAGGGRDRDPMLAVGAAGCSRGDCGRRNVVIATGDHRRERMAHRKSGRRRLLLLLQLLLVLVLGAHDYVVYQVGPLELLLVEVAWRLFERLGQRAVRTSERLGNTGGHRWRRGRRGGGRRGR